MILRHALLGLLAIRPATGYDLAKAFGGSFGYAWGAQHSQIYPELARLLEQGLIEVREEGPRGRKVYGVTAAGMARLRSWLRETQPDQTPRNEVVLRTFMLWALEPDEAVAFLRRQASEHRQKLETFEQIAQEMEEDELQGTPRPPPPAGLFHRIALEWGLRWAAAFAEWADWAADEVERETTARVKRGKPRMRARE
jgi:PadR family transcriptional regulator, regulatory protein AphA